MNSFKFIGQIKVLKDTKDKKYIETVNFDSGWMIERVKFRMACGDSAEFIDLSGGKFKDDSKNTVYTLFKKSGSEKEVEKTQVEWGKRFDADVLDKVPSYKKYIVDLSSDKIRKDLKEKIEKEKDGNARAELEKALDEAIKSKFAYISQYDFAIKVGELLKAGAFDNGNFIVSGTVEYNYSIKDSDEGKYYRSFVPTNIYRATDSDEPSATGRIDLYYLKDEVIMEECENGDVPVSGFLQFYERMSQENFYVPMAVYMRGSDEKTEGLKKVFGIDKEGDVLTLGINVEYFDGSPKEEITLESLDDESKQLIEWGVKTFEEIKADMGGGSYGDTVSKIYMTGIARGWKAPISSDVEVDKLYAKPDGKKKDKKKTETNTKKKFDLFNDEDDDEI